MTGRDDLQADLDEIAARLDDGPGYNVLVNLATRLRHLLDDRDLSDAPWTSEIIAHLEAGGTVEVWLPKTGTWKAISGGVAYWCDRLTQHGDKRQHGYRLAPLPPATERVLVRDLWGRTLVDETWEIAQMWRLGDQWSVSTPGRKWRDLDVADDGTVEVLR